MPNPIWYKAYEETLIFVVLLQSIFHAAPPFRWGFFVFTYNPLKL